jgi:hypothetical protein
MEGVLARLARGWLSIRRPALALSLIWARGSRRRPTTPYFLFLQIAMIWVRSLSVFTGTCRSPVAQAEDEARPWQYLAHLMRFRVCLAPIPYYSHSSCFKSCARGRCGAGRHDAWGRWSSIAIRLSRHRLCGLPTHVSDAAASLMSWPLGCKPGLLVPSFNFGSID